MNHAQENDRTEQENNREVLLDHFKQWSQTCDEHNQKLYGSFEKASFFPVPETFVSSIFALARSSRT